MSSVRLFRLAGIPVTVSVWFFVVVGILGAQSGSVSTGLTWIAAVFIGLLIHEFGHGFVAKYYGLGPRIVLHGWGGLCHHSPARTALQDILVTAAGPGAGLIVGGIMAAFGAHEISGPSPSVLDRGLYFLTWINIVWSLANLIPLWPLDGGQIFQVVLRSKQGTYRGDRITHTVGAILGGVLLVYMLLSREIWLTIVLAVLLFKNIEKLRTSATPVYHSPYRAQSGVSGSQGVFGFDWRPTLITRRLMWVVGALWVAVLVVSSISGGEPVVRSLYETFHLDAEESTVSFQIWQFFTYIWLHDLQGLGHIFGNLFGLLILGPILERVMGGYRFLKLFLQCGLGAGVFTVLVAWLFPATFGTAVVGASGSLFGLVAAVSILLPREKMLLFFIAPIEARWLIWLVLGFDTVSFFASSNSDLAWQTHVGGALTAWLIIHRTWDPRLLWDHWRLWRIGRGPRKPKRPNLKVIPGGKDDPPTLH